MSRVGVAVGPEPRGWPITDPGGGPGTAPRGRRDGARRTVRNAAYGGFHRMRDEGWIGVDLDGTTAFYGAWVGGGIGEPVPAMADRIRRWLAEGYDVRIVTARVADDGRPGLRPVDAMRGLIQD